MHFYAKQKNSEELIVDYVKPRSVMSYWKAGVQLGVGF